MNFDEIRKAFDSGKNNEVQSICEKILKIKDLDLLGQLSHDVNELVRYLAFYKSKEVNRYEHYRPSLVAQLLSNISNGKCRCSMYPFSSQDVTTEEENGFVEILETEEDVPHLHARYLCKCNYCAAKYSVDVGDSGHFIKYEWKLKF
jgi:hypothetical protein